MAGLYIHIPFCKQACHYCDFHFSTNQDLRTDLVEAISKEIVLQKDYLGGEEIRTIYLGGGTPSLLDGQELQTLLKTIRETHPVIGNPEVTLEANPDDLTLPKLQELYRIGINRLSIGIQSFHSEFLTFLNRVHDADSAIRCFHHAREAGFKNISVDLIYAIPGESLSQWKEDIQQMIDLQPDHVSCYALTIEEKTVFGRWSVSGKLKATDDETAAHHLEILMEELEKAGFEHYEISNFARPGFYSKHNSSYWRQAKYLGVGPSAHSYNGTSRQFNVNNNSAYINSLRNNTIPFEGEVLTRENKINEYILTTLRTKWGTDLKKIKEDYAYDLLNENKHYLSKILENELVMLESDVLRLTRKGKLLADKISSDLFLTHP
jgi:oxygen-independent coproporphyrinogen-3 oxidase